MIQEAVEYYSGMNDEKYIYFTERIQNTLLKPEVLQIMKEANEPSKRIIMKEKSLNFQS